MHKRLRRGIGNKTTHTTNTLPMSFSLKKKKPLLFSLFKSAVKKPKITFYLKIPYMYGIDLYHESSSIKESV